ncbi:hypothetical protein [Methylobacterium sp. yr596]|uniref:hypothetical protein n=1 Tax=Methylobacterium sp. yr596 TaxID=1761800 RepID=UPI001113C5DB|nr:hypothetical protein [Methylobacterium sp. yr596]
MIYTLKENDGRSRLKVPFVNDNWMQVQGPNAETVAAEVHATLTDETTLAAFARDVLHHAFAGIDLDGAEIQGLGLAYGLLAETAYDPERHGPNDYDVKPGESWLEYDGPLARIEPK